MTGRVAIKFLSARFNADKSANDRFLREAKAVAKLDHPNVVPIHEFGEADGNSFMVMAYMEGDSLRDALDRSQG